MDLLTMQEFHALMDRHQENAKQDQFFQDYFHARTAASMGAGKIDKLMITKQPANPAVPQQDLAAKVTEVMLAFGAEE